MRASDKLRRSNELALRALLTGEPVPIEELATREDVKRYLREEWTSWTGAIGHSFAPSHVPVDEDDE